MFTGSVYPIVVEALKSGDYIVEDGSKITAGLAGIDKNGKFAKPKWKPYGDVDTLLNIH